MKKMIVICGSIEEGKGMATVSYMPEDSIQETAIQVEQLSQMEREVVEASVACLEAESADWIEREVGNDPERTAKELRAAKVRWCNVAEDLRLARKASVKEQSK